MLAACARTGADAIHPGYGFLAENASFAQMVQDAGIAWVGPPPKAISAMGDKLSAKKLMRDSNVPTLPAAEINAGDDIAAAANEIEAIVDLRRRSLELAAMKLSTQFWISCMPRHPIR